MPVREHEVDALLLERGDPGRRGGGGHGQRAHAAGLHRLLDVAKLRDAGRGRLRGRGQAHLRGIGADGLGEVGRQQVRGAAAGARVPGDRRRIGLEGARQVGHRAVRGAGRHEDGVVARGQARERRRLLESRRRGIQLGGDHEILARHEDRLRVALRRFQERGQALGPARAAAIGVLDLGGRLHGQEGRSQRAAGPVPGGSGLRGDHDAHGRLREAGGGREERGEGEDGSG